MIILRRTFHYFTQLPLEHIEGFAPPPSLFGAKRALIVALHVFDALRGITPPIGGPGRSRTDVRKSNLTKHYKLSRWINLILMSYQRQN